jgi:hypothetical protein
MDMAETCRGVWRNILKIKLHQVGFSLNEYIEMHGQQNEYIEMHGQQNEYIEMHGQ